MIRCIVFVTDARKRCLYPKGEHGTLRFLVKLWENGEWTCLTLFFGIQKRRPLTVEREIELPDG